MQGSDDKQGVADPSGRGEFRSSRDSLRKSSSLTNLRDLQDALPRPTSGELLWGRNHSDFEKDDDVKLETILKENRERRAPRDEFVGLLGREWFVEGFETGTPNSPMYVYHDSGKLGQGVTIRRCTGAVIDVTNKCSHVMINDVHHSKIRIAGVVASIEMVHCEGVELVLRGPVPVLQIDLSRSIRITFSDISSRPKIVNASNTELSAADSQSGHVDTLPTTMFGDQIISFYKKITEASGSAVWKLESIPAAQLKSDGGGYVELAGVSGSITDLAAMEEQAKRQKKHNGQ